MQTGVELHGMFKQHIELDVIENAVKFMHTT